MVRCPLQPLRQAVLIGFVLSVKLTLDMMDPAGGRKQPAFKVTEEDVMVRFDAAPSPPAPFPSSVPVLAFRPLVWTVYACSLRVQQDSSAKLRFD